MDDTTIIEVSDNINSTALQDDANTADEWSNRNDMSINATKTFEIRMDFSKIRGSVNQLFIDNTPIEVVHHSKILGVIVSDDLKWNKHVEYITRKASQRLHLLVLCRRAGIGNNEIKLMYITKIRPVLEYACAAWHPGLCQYLNDDIERI